MAAPHLTAATSPTFARPAGDAASKVARVKEHLRSVANELGLTDAQKDQLRVLFKAEHAKALAIRQDPALNRREKLHQLRALRDEVQEKVQGLLTPEQWAQWLQLREEKREAIRSRLGGA
ncbi:MAG: hypothetical protein JNK85_08670 [Verrucomicrobiales bacterium]|nr:hypothetical protein [Verrucomicrobiales bacterium]